MFIVKKRLTIPKG